MAAAAPFPHSRTPLVSVVIPMRDRAAWIAGALDSVAAQTYRPVEIVAVDNGSSDGSLEAVRAWSQAHRQPTLTVRVEEEANPGASTARNKGLLSCSGSLVTFLDSDDRMLPTLLHKAVQAQLDSGAGLVAWRRRIEGGPHHGRLNRLPHGNALECQIVHCCLSTQSFMATSDLLRRTGPWNVALPVWNDLEFGLRILASKPRVKCLTQTLCVTHWHEDSLTGSSFGARAGQWEKSLHAIDGFMHSRGLERPRRAVAYRMAVLAGLYRREGLFCQADSLLDSLRATFSLKDRLVLRAVARWVAAGFRGASHWALPLLSPPPPSH